MAGLAQLATKVEDSLAKLAYPARPWVKSLPAQAGGHVYDVVIIGGGQCGLAAAFGLMREQVSNILVLDENEAGREGPWMTYARMITLRTNKALTGTVQCIA
ncbi:hypothetical protein TSOC_009437 [Tetrabaena socialis]|uniref:FAD-dependent urate hydroxylase HpyO/Asp monooxygenase CreE-like FAD/NAD(P)-binding domain-containing protein n=1 Tax=Tetrabaena socialis TaxID=47790 RepID=A0A2J7ZVX2_9CHLO|nr:hypothetical protein TSOC_009437 [Tetrabaena socialis]|eukprot:PNH04405.1 hypothetical protein TSOC_009437 [Tetrabaena socialis]